jgi:hypothetical protein
VSATTTRSARTVRFQARAPRVAFYGLMAILALVGVRSLVAGPPEPSTITQVVRSGPTVATTSFAESFARAYLTWPADDRGAREALLAPFLAKGLDSHAGVQPAGGVTQSVQWASAVAAREAGRRTVVTVAAQTNTGLLYLAVTVAVSVRGYLAVVAYPSIVGAPAVDHDLQMPTGDAVDDDALTVVVGRALRNYLAGSEANLRADLAPEAVVSLPTRRLQAGQVDDLTWATFGRRVATEVVATDEAGSSFTLRYELDVERRDRWYVRTLTVEPTTKESS